MNRPPPTLCAVCQRGHAAPNCPACHDLQNARWLLAHPHTAFGLSTPATITVLASQPGLLVLRRKNDPFQATAFITFGAFVIALMIYIFVVSGTETLYFVVPLVLISLAGIGFGIRALMYRQSITLEHRTLTVGSPKTTSSVKDIEQLVVAALHSTHWHKGLRWHTIYRLHAQSRGASFLVLSGTHEEVRFVEASLEAVLGIADDPSRNVVTTAGS